MRGDAELVAWARDECFENPLEYVSRAFAWGHGDLADWQGPDGWQRDLLSDLARGCVTAEAAVQLATASGHGVGKSALVAWIVLWAMSTRPHLAGVVTANTGQQLEQKTWRELALWHKRALNGHWFRWTATRFYHMHHPETWFVSAVPWSKERPEAFAGLHAEHVLMIFDEASAVDDIIWETAEGALTTKRAMWLVFGNPTRNTGRFRECFGRFRHRWATRQVDSRTAKAANQVQLAQWVDDYGEDSDFVRVRVRGQFPRAGVSQFIASDVAEAAMSRQLEFTDPGAPLVMGVDVARFGDDQTVVRLRQGRNARVYPPVKWRGMNTVFTSNKLAELILATKPDAVFIDGGGVGGGVVDQLRNFGIRVVDVNFGAAARDSSKYANKRCEMWGDMRDWLPTGAVDRDQELLDDMIGIEYGYDKDSRIQLEKKADMKKRGLASPDNGDALALTFAGPVQRRDERTSRHRPMRQSQTDYSVLG